MDESLISEHLEAASDGGTARNFRKQVQTLRGIRGTPFGDVARIAGEVWRSSPPTLGSEVELTRLFMSAWEDGLLAVGLLAALVPDDPQEAFDLGLDWLTRVDDNQTADALGWLVLGPAFAATGADPERLSDLIAEHKAGHPSTRRALAAMGLSFLPLPLEGPSASPLRVRHGQDDLTFVEEPLSALLSALCTGLLRDESPQVRKVLRRLLRSWTKVDPEAVVAWEQTVRGGLPKLLSAETKRARSRVKP